MTTKKETSHQGYGSHLRKEGIMLLLLLLISLPFFTSGLIWSVALTTFYCSKQR